MLILLICVGEYDSANLLPLPGTQNDKARLKLLFHDLYRYKIILNETPRVTEDDLDKLLLEAKHAFKNREENYKGIMVFYSGHGDLTNLVLSDYDTDSHGTITGVYPRSKLISYFNGNNIRTKAQSYKLFFMDACRGAELAQIFLASDDIVVGGKGAKWMHPETNRGILYSNTNNVQSYEIVYDKDTDDIAWHRLTPDLYMKNEDQPKCGIFMNAVYHIFKANATKYGFRMNYATIQDQIKQKASKKVPVHGDFDTKVGQKIEYSDTLDNDDKTRMFFAEKDDEKKQSENDHEQGQIAKDKKFDDITPSSMEQILELLEDNYSADDQKLEEQIDALDDEIQDLRDMVLSLMDSTNNNISPYASVSSDLGPLIRKINRMYNMLSGSNDNMESRTFVDNNESQDNAQELENIVDDGNTVKKPGFVEGWVPSICLSAIILSTMYYVKGKYLK